MLFGLILFRWVMSCLIVMIGMLLWVLSLSSLGRCIMLLFLVMILVIVLIGWSLVSFISLIVVLVWLLCLCILLFMVCRGSMWLGWMMLVVVDLGFVSMLSVWV